MHRVVIKHKKGGILANESLDVIVVVNSIT